MSLHDLGALIGTLLLGILFGTILWLILVQVANLVREYRLARRWPKMHNAWNEGYDAALNDFPCTHSVEPSSHTENPFGELW